MEQAQFMGLLITCIGSLLAIASVLVAIVIKPIINLNKTITKLDSTIENIQKEETTLVDRVNKHGTQIDSLNVQVASHEVLINNHNNDLIELRSATYKGKSK